ncbi:GerW family sporulation protein [Methanolobus halotolerans]|uniref:Sporulation protein n=1 Tax=Methanolobus halotolerans TaxID=2052935 RepID=A0A4E0PYC6_9EURY|nr:spore germination protein GerW family protein [Methanolobus halotolerans]TGC11144.1 sporulation protein [Methanolobus halotolerans]
MAVEEIIKDISNELERLVSTKTVVGDPVICGDTTIIPVTKVSFGFGSGGGEGKKKGEEEGFGGGGGAGAKIEPIAFIIMSPTGVELLPITGKGGLDKVMESFPGLVDKVKSMTNKSKKGKGEETDIYGAPETPGEAQTRAESSAK